jgi:hypothetical protein
VIHAALDRLAVLTRSDAAGTLKWPGVASALIPFQVPVIVEVPPSVGPLAPPVDPVAPALPTPAEPASVLRATTVSYRPSAPPEVSDAHFAAARAVVHAEIGAPSKPPPAQGGHVEGAAMMGVCVLALAASLVCAGCPLVREAAMRAAPGVPDPVGCVAGVQRCDGLIPVVCSATAREWAALPRSASGEPRTCAPGVCVVSDAGIAHCAPAATDGGAL